MALNVESIKVNAEDNSCGAKTKRFCCNPVSFAGALCTSIIMVIVGCLIAGYSIAVLRPFDDVIMTTSPIPPRGFKYSAPLYAGAGTWASKPDMPKDLSDHTAVAVGGSTPYLVVICGGVSDLNVENTLCWEYNTVRETFNATVPMPRPRFRHASVVYQNRYVYLFGGKMNYSTDQTTTAVDRYDLRTWTWETVATMPEERSDMTATVFGDKIYLFGGYASNYSNPAPVLIFNPATNAWTTGADLPTPRGDANSVAFNGKIYVVGGWEPQADYTYLPSKRVDIYDPASNSFSAGAPMNIGRGDFAMVAIDSADIIVVLGGETTSERTGENEVPMHFSEEYNVLSDNWSPRAPIPEARFRTAAVTLPNTAPGSVQILVIGGQGPRRMNHADISVLYRLQHANLYVHIRDEPANGPKA